MASVQNTPYPGSLTPEISTSLYKLEPGVGGRAKTKAKEVGYSLLLGRRGERVSSRSLTRGRDLPPPQTLPTRSISLVILPIRSIWIDLIEYTCSNALDEGSDD